MTVRVRRALLVLSAVALSVLTVLPLWLFRSVLPQPMATQWDLGGAPQQAMSVLAFGLLMGGLTLLGACAVVWAGLARDLPRTVRASLAGLGGGHAALLAGVALQVTLGQRGVVDWRAASGPRFWEVALIFGAAGVLGWALARVARGWPEEPPRDASAGQGQAATLGLGPDEQAVWVRRVSAPWLYGLAALGVALLGLGLVLGQWSLVLTGGVLIPVSTEMATAVVSVDQRGLWVRWGMFGLWRTGVPMGDVLKAEAIEIRPLEWGGWGYRGSLRLLGRAAVVLRRGPGVRVELRGGRVLAVTVDDAGTAAGLLNDLVAREAL